jgi:urease accessory protein
VDVQLTLAEHAWLEWLPQETILFDRARLRRRLVLDLAESARLLAADLLVFGRRARGERFRRGLLHDRWEVRSAGRLVWADALCLAEDPGGLLEAPFGFAGTGAAVTAIYVAPDAADYVLEGARDGRSVAELMSAGGEVLRHAQVMAGVAEMIHEVQVEAIFRDGTKLVTLHHPVR